MMEKCIKCGKKHRNCDCKASVYEQALAFGYEMEARLNKAAMGQKQKDHDHE